MTIVLQVIASPTFKQRPDVAAPMTSAPIHPSQPLFPFQPESSQYFSVANSTNLPQKYP
jgi:hypothetical protein